MFEQELEELVSGTTDINVAAVKAGCTLDGFTASDAAIALLWQALSRFTSRHVRAFIRPTHLLTHAHLAPTETLASFCALLRAALDCLPLSQSPKAVPS